MLTAAALSTTIVRLTDARAELVTALAAAPGHADAVQAQTTINAMATAIKGYKYLQARRDLAEAQESLAAATTREQALRDVIAAGV